MSAQRTLRTLRTLPVCVCVCVLTYAQHTVISLHIITNTPITTRMITTAVVLAERRNCNRNTVVHILTFKLRV